MTSATKRKHVVREMLENFDNLQPHQTIVKILGTAGCNLHKVITPLDEMFLASLPTKFRKNIWIKRGDFVVIEPIHEGNKVKGEIVRILYPQHIKALKEANMWPVEFDHAKNATPAQNYTTMEQDSSSSNPCSAIHNNGMSSTGEESEEDDFSDIPMNTNRPPQIILADSEDGTSDDEEEDDE